uniref:Uncharacterized protein n=1 Tax=Meloidogyne enterolobii TaxID=390850 RepID=A0A6V7UFB0_MELEN|nr:unnamed protein product [Meloidogyne enterolobii]
MTLSESATCFKIKDLLNNYNIFNTPLNTAENELTDEVEESEFNYLVQQQSSLFSVWYNVSLGSIGQRPCPFQFCKSLPECEFMEQTYTASRYCFENGTWGDSMYGQCIQLLKVYPQCVAGYCRTCPNLLRDTVIRVSLSLSVVSVCVLLAALVLFSAFDSVQCRRLSIHKNLAAAFVLRFAILALWTFLNTRNAFQDCSQFAPLHLRQWEWLCKSLLFGLIYFQVASVMWMLIEGVYLYSRFTVFAMRRSEAPYFVYLFTGWVLPFLVVASWATIHERQSESRSFCWLPYAKGPHLWILAGTMGMALILNVFLLLLIIIILVRKLRHESSAESRQIWRTVKATMLLVPLLGVSNVPLFYEPPQPSAFYMLGSAILQHSQGIFIAVLYCFLNAEIQNALKRQISKVPLLRAILSGGSRESRRQFETERTFIPAGQTDEDLQMSDLPMRCKNGTVRGPRINGKTKQSNSMNAGINWHANNNNNNNCKLEENEEVKFEKDYSDFMSTSFLSGTNLINLDENLNERGEGKNKNEEEIERRRAESTGSKLRFT